MSPQLIPSAAQRTEIRATADGDRAAQVICAFATGRHLELLAEAAPTYVAYGRRRQWDVVLSSEYGDVERPAAWKKLLLVQSLLQQYGTVLCIDADAIIVDVGRSILAEVDDSADLWLAHHPQEHDPDATVANTGVMLVRASPFATAILQAMWASEQYIDHNWWENAALLDLLGYSLDAPYPIVRHTPWQERVGRLDLAWNSVPGYCESPAPALNHHARSDHDNFGRRLKEMRANRIMTEQRFAGDFVQPE